MKHWKDIAFGLFVSLTLAACYGEEDSFATPTYSSLFSQPELLPSHVR